MAKKTSPRSDRIFIGVISYITIIGWIIALILYNEHKTKFTETHLRQALFLHILSLIFALIPFLNLFNVIILVFWIIGIINASMGKKDPLPLVGKIALNLFKNI